MTTSAERKAARKRWANLIRHIYEVDPLVCPRCGGMIKIISFILAGGLCPEKRTGALTCAAPHPAFGHLLPAAGGEKGYAGIYALAPYLHARHE